MNVKVRYNLLSFLFYVAGCCIGGFVAIFLQYKGVSNTLIGMVTGLSCVAAIFMTPYFSSLMVRIPFLNVKRMILFVYLFLAIGYTIVTFSNLPSLVVMIFFTVVLAVYFSAGPFLQVMASDYMRMGIDVNFGMARGLGSIAWAVTALIFGYLVEWFNSRILCFGFLLFTGLMFILLLSMPNIETVSQGNKKDGSLLKVLSKYPIFCLTVTGFALFYAGATTLSTYLINIVESLGGTTAFYGIAIFIMAFSEMPVMAITPKLMKRYKSIHLIAFAGFCYTVRNVLMCIAPNLWILCIGILFQGLSFGLLTAVITYYVIFNFLPIDQVMGQTLIVIFTSGVGSMIGNMFGGILQDHFGLFGMYVFVLILTVLGGLLILSIRYLYTKEAYRKEVKR